MFAMLPSMHVGDRLVLQGIRNAGRAADVIHEHTATFSMGAGWFDTGDLARTYAYSKLGITSAAGAPRNLSSAQPPSGVAGNRGLLYRLQ